ncbi:MAG: DUF3187 family protein [Nitrospinae bacterium]|nr:DUF3187 family protein [Nitrospinota bacterium]
MRTLVMIAALLLPWVAPAAGEPLPVKNHSPVWFGLLFPTPDASRAVAEGEPHYRLDLDYSSIFFVQKDKGWEFLFDMELAQATLNARIGFSGGVEAGIEQPFFHMGGGFMDDAVTNYHSWFGFPMYDGQLGAPRYRFSYRMARNGAVWHGAAPYTVTAGDTTFWLKKELCAKDAATISLKLVGQAPTASTAEGMGNGAWEYGALILADREFREKGKLGLSAGYIDPGFINRGDYFPLNRFYYLDASLEYPFGRWAGVVQFTGATSPYGNAGPDLLSREWQAITFGARYLTDGGKKLEFSFTEDLSFSAPDFTLHAGVEF